MEKTLAFPHGVNDEDSRAGSQDDEGACASPLLCRQTFLGPFLFAPVRSAMSNPENSSDLDKLFLRDFCRKLSLRDFFFFA